MVANGTFVNASVVASGVGDVYVIGVENAVSVNLAGTASVTIAAEAGDDFTLSHKVCALNQIQDYISSLQRHVKDMRTTWRDMA